jgi:hypothetical protein
MTTVHKPYFNKKHSTLQHILFHSGEDGIERNFQKFIGAENTKQH